MKIIAEGIWKKPWSKEIHCHTKECDATLLVEENDLIAPDCYSSDTRRYEFVCPICGKKNALPPMDLPTRVKEALDAKRKVHTVSSWGGYD